MEQANNTPTYEPTTHGILARLPLRALRWLETKGLEMDHSRLRKTYAERDDAWFISYEGQVEGPYSFRQVSGLLLEGISPLQLIHASESNDESAQWTTLRYSPLWLRKGPALAWRIGFWIVAAMFAYCAVHSFTPYSWRWLGDSVFLMLLAIAALAAFMPKRFRRDNRMPDELRAMP